MARSEAPYDPRQYVRITTDIAMNPKLAVIDNPAAGWTYVCSITTSGGSFADGHFPVAAVLRLAGTDKDVAEALVEQGLWHLPGHGCDRCPQPKAGYAYIHDFLQHQRSKDEAMELTEKRREAGRAGARKRWANTNAPEVTGKPIANAEASADQPLWQDDDTSIASAMANGQHVPWQMDGKAIAEERRGEKNKVKSSRASPSDDATAKDFAEWWAVYPKRRAKIAAERAYRAALKKVTAERLLAAATSYRDDSARQRNEPKFTKDPATWLNGGCWDDEPDQPAHTGPRPFWEN